MEEEDTIFALASGTGRAGVAVVRVSGPAATTCVQRLGVTVPEPRYASLRNILTLEGQLIDQGLVIFFPAGKSFTGEDVVELQVHGGRAILNRLFSELGKQDHVRAAQPGEFTRRAVENGRMDLAEAEGLVDLVDAETWDSLRNAHNLANGTFSNVVESIREDLLAARSLIEATIDFADEEVPVDVTDPVAEILAGVSVKLEQLLDGAKRSVSSKEGYEVAIIGRPNAGKSTLLNYIAGRDVAIASEVAGTTRDVIEVRVELEGQLFVFLDTAGIRETADVVERVGVEKALSRSSESDVRVVLWDGVDAWWKEQFSELGCIVCLQKDDDGLDETGVSGVSGFGIDRLLGDVVKEVAVSDGCLGMGNNRHIELLQRANSVLLNSVDEYCGAHSKAELLAENLRVVGDALGEIVGEYSVEDVLGGVFSRFCIGK